VVLGRALSNSPPLLAAGKFLDSKRSWFDLPPRDKQAVQKQHQVRLDKAGEQQAIDAYISGKTIYEVGTQFGIHRTTVSAILKRNSVKMRRMPKRGYSRQTPDNTPHT
jgi:hypothetical protein